MRGIMSKMNEKDLITREDTDKITSIKLQKQFYFCIVSVKTCMGRRSLTTM